SQVNGSFLDEGLIDKLILFISPKLIGDKQALGIFEGKGVATLKEAIPLNELRVRRIGEDILLEGYVEPLPSDEERGIESCLLES
ncbi:MAG: dihydrofolate reductase family protein, partial [Thermodesulfobacteriota bacterium]